MTPPLALAPLALSLCSSVGAQGAAPGACGDGVAFERAFDSGAVWSACLIADPVHGLRVDALAYRAPGDAMRPVLASLHPASILVQRRTETGPTERLDAAATALAETADTCAGEPVPLGSDGSTACVRRTRTGILAKYGDIAGVQGGAWWIESTRRTGAQAWRTRVGLGEDGRIDAVLALVDGLDDELVARTTWRVAFALDTPAPDRVEQLDFAIDAGGVRRPMRVSALRVETLRRTAPTRFRAWRAVDATGAGYLLDPQSAVAAAPGLGANWTGFELAVTVADDVERHASLAPTLDGFVDGETLAGADPVLWHALAMTVRPDAGDAPSVRPRELGFALLPFDWTAASPFPEPER